jgi:hypothetical protein
MKTPEETILAISKELKDSTDPYLIGVRDGLKIAYRLLKPAKGNPDFTCCEYSSKSKPLDAVVEANKRAHQELMERYDKYRLMNNPGQELKDQPINPHIIGPLSGGG